jgi:hypothetical protein
MTKDFNHPTLDLRYMIEALVSADNTQPDIAKVIDVHRISNYREFIRNVPGRGRVAVLYYILNLSLSCFLHLISHVFENAFDG